MYCSVGTHEIGMNATKNNETNGLMELRCDAMPRLACRFREDPSVNGRVGVVENE
jgi:hypothetical protein